MLLFLRMSNNYWLLLFILDDDEFFDLPSDLPSDGELTPTNETVNNSTNNTSTNGLVEKALERLENELVELVSLPLYSIFLKRWYKSQLIFCFLVQVCTSSFFCKQQPSFDVVWLFKIRPVSYIHITVAIHEVAYLTFIRNS